MSRNSQWILGLGVLALTFALAGKGDAPSGQPMSSAGSYCDVIAGRLPYGKDPAFLVSFESSPNGRALDPSLENAAFVYDNALATIALVACGRTRDAKRIAEAIAFASRHDRSYRDGRLRNAYRAGSVREAPVPLAGWWDKGQRRWLEDASQAGTSVGNAAWAGLALLNVYAATGDQTFLDGARRILSWIAAQPHVGPGFSGGFFGHEPDPANLTWKSTEHNVDIYAAFEWLAAIESRDGLDVSTWRLAADASRAFVTAMFDEVEGWFFIGTDVDGETPVRSRIGLDAQLWPILAFPDAPGPWRHALAWTERHLSVGDGFDFNEDRDGIWIEGTAQAALVYSALGQNKKAEQLQRFISKQRSPDGLVFATDRTVLTTGLAVGPQSKDADFEYQRLPHLGATAWAAIAQARWNPFMGRRVSN